MVLQATHLLKSFIRIFCMNCSLLKGDSGGRTCWEPNIADWTVLSRYREGEMCHDDVHEIMAEYGYQDFASQLERFRFLRWLCTRAW